MPGAEVAEYGVAALAVAGVLYLAGQLVRWRNSNGLAEVIRNNTEALEALRACLSKLMERTARQEAMLDELLDHARRRSTS